MRRSAWSKRDYDASIGASGPAPELVTVANCVSVSFDLGVDCAGRGTPGIGVPAPAGGRDRDLLEPAAVQPDMDVSLTGDHTEGIESEQAGQHVAAQSGDALLQPSRNSRGSQAGQQ
jgi:hypothetical protein